MLCCRRCSDHRSSQMLVTEEKIEWEEKLWACHFCQRCRTMRRSTLRLLHCTSTALCGIIDAAAKWLPSISSIILVQTLKGLFSSKKRVYGPVTCNPNRIKRMSAGASIEPVTWENLVCCRMSLMCVEQIASSNTFRFPQRCPVICSTDFHP